MQNAKDISIHMCTSLYLNKDDRGKLLEESKHISVIGYLLYRIASCHNIMIIICMCALLQSDTKELHLYVVKHVIKYLIDT